MDPLTVKPQPTRDDVAKAQLYDRYFSAHIAPRKGVATLDEFKRRAVAYRSHFGSFVGADRGKRVLDLGCGNGSVAWWLQQEGFSAVEGIDISREQVEEAHRLGVKGVVCADLREFLPARRGAYDVIITRDLLEHLTRADLLATLELCHAALADGGAIIIQAPNAASPFGSRIRYSDLTHELAFTTASMSQLLYAAGFESIRCRGIEPHVHGPASLLRLVVWKLVSAVYKSLLFIEVGGGFKHVVSQNLVCVARKPAVRV